MGHNVKIDGQFNHFNVVRGKTDDTFRCTKNDCHNTDESSKTCRYMTQTRSRSIDFVDFACDYVFESL